MFNTLMLVAIALFIFAFALTYYKIEYGFYLYVLTIPLMHKELFSLGYWDLLPIRFVAIGISLAAFVIFIKWRKKVGKTKCRAKIKSILTKDYFLILLLLLLVIRGISLFESQNLVYSIGLFLFYGSAVAIYIVYRTVLDSFGEKWYYKLLGAYLIVGLLASIFAYVQLVLRFCCRVKVGGVWVNPGNLPRLGSTFWDVNHFGGFLVTLIPLTFALIFAVKKPIYKAGLVLFTISSLFLLFMTQSRSSWIGLFIGLLLSLVLYYLLKLRRPLWLAVVGGILVVILGISFITYKQIDVRQKVADYMHYRLDSTDTHVMLLEGASEIFVNNLVLGSGYGNFNDAFRQTKTAQSYFDREPKLREMRVPPHSIWGEAIAETGTIGIVTYGLFAVLLLATIVVAISTEKDKSKKYLGVGLLGSLASLFSAGLFYSYNMEFYWFYIFLTIGFTFITLKDKFSLMYVLKWWYDKPITPYLIIVPPSIFFIFLRLGTNTLIDWDEAIYAKVAKNMLESGDYLNLHWRSMQEYWFEKPPFYMWSTVLMYKIFGINAFASRLTSAIFGFLGIILTYKFGKKLYNKLTGIVAALALLSTVHYLYYSRNGMLDVTVTFFMMLSLYFFYSAVVKFNESITSIQKGVKKEKSAQTYSAILSKTKNPIIYHKHATSIATYMMLAGISMGFAIMTKAIVGLIPLAIMVFYLLYIILFTDKKVPIKEFLLLILFALIVALPWHLYMTMMHGSEFINSYLLDHIIGRGLAGFGHEKPIWWFFEVMKVSLRIWIIPLILGLVILPFIDKNKKDSYIYLLISFIIILLFFSISKDKLQWYIIPIYPISVIIAARLIDRLLVSANALLKKDVKLDYELLRIIAIFVLFLTSVLYIIIMRNRVWLNDPNKDKVALIKVHNSLYPKEKYPNRKLYFTRAVTPTLLFYTEHDIKKVNDLVDVLDVIEKSPPDQNNVFLMPDSLYYELKSSQGKIDAPIGLDEKGSAGGWILVKALSRVEVLRNRFNKINLMIAPLQRKKLGGTITPEEEEKLNKLIEESREIRKQLEEYGYPIEKKTQSPEPINK